MFVELRGNPSAPRFLAMQALVFGQSARALGEECLQTVTLHTLHRQKNVAFRVREDLFPDTLVFYIYNTLTRSDNLPN